MLRGAGAIHRAHTARLMVVAAQCMYRDEKCDRPPGLRPRSEAVVRLEEVATSQAPQAMNQHQDACTHFDEGDEDGDDVAAAAAQGGSSSMLTKYGLDDAVRQQLAS